MDGERDAGWPVLHPVDDFAGVPCLPAQGRWSTPPLTAITGISEVAPIKLAPNTRWRGTRYIPQPKLST
jgi:hypothetical protein